MTDPIYEEYLKGELGEMMIRAMNNKAEILADLHSNMNKAAKTDKGLQKFEEFCKKIEAGESEDLSPRAAAQMIRVLSQTVRAQARSIRHLCAFAMIYGLGDSYDADAARAASKFGRGTEGLQAMFRNKFGTNPFDGKK
jgi:hypothetical protein